MDSSNKYNYNQEFATDSYYFSDISFHKLMQKRINNVLLVCSTYDAFMLEEDGRINEKIFLEIYIAQSSLSTAVFSGRLF